MSEKDPQPDAGLTNGHTDQPQKDAEKQDDHAQQNRDEEQKDGQAPQHIDEEKKDKGPEGGYDDTPIPSAPPGYTLKITFHRATQLPMADLNTLSSDPYIIAQINTDVPNRHKEDPALRFRTPTIRRDTEPVWNEEWIVANVPASGFRLKMRVYDEDPGDKDDRLGNVHIDVPSLNENWGGIKDQSYEIKARSGSKRAYLIRAVAVCFQSAKHMRGNLFVSIEMLGRTQEDGQNGRLYTVGQCRWIRHYSPILGRVAGIREPDDENKQQQDHQPSPDGKKKSGGVEHYNFQANQFQLEGPVPAKLYHRFVEFKPWVGRMFTSKGVQGWFLGKALRHQHSRVYNFGRQTEWGHFPQGPCTEMTKKFLDLVHYDKGGRIFTYVLTLDGLWRFTETGKEFGIDMLSKHTMHSDVSIYIAFSGEFFIRRLKHPRRPPPPDPVDETSQNHPPEHGPNPTHPVEDIDGGPPNEEPPMDPSYYQLVIDNDSGTYRPNADLLPLLKDFMARSLPGLHIQTLDCQKDEEKMNKMKDEQRQKKKAEGDHIVFTQGSRSSSISSSDEEDLDRMEADIGSSNARKEPGAFSQVARDRKLRAEGKLDSAKRKYGGRGRGGEDDVNGAGREGGDAQPGAGSS